MIPANRRSRPYHLTPWRRPAYAEAARRIGVALLVIVTALVLVALYPNK